MSSSLASARTAGALIDQKAVKHRNSLARAAMLAARALEQIGRKPGFTQMLRRPRGHVGDWDPSTPKEFRSHALRVFPASHNRRTGQPHKHLRVKARYAGRVR